MAFEVAHIAGISGGYAPTVDDPLAGPLGLDGRPTGARVFYPGHSVDIAVVVLTIEPRSLDRSIARQIGPPIYTVQGLIQHIKLILGKGEWSVAERTTFMEYLCNERS